MAYDFEKPSSRIVLLVHAGLGDDRRELALVEELAVDLVGQHRDAALGGDRRDALDLARGRARRRSGSRGELMMMSFVLGDTRCSNSARSKPKPLSSRSGIGTGTPPTKLITDS